MFPPLLGAVNVTVRYPFRTGSTAPVSGRVYGYAHGANLSGRINSFINLAPGTTVSGELYAPASPAGASTVQLICVEGAIVHKIAVIPAAQDERALAVRRGGGPPANPVIETATSVEPRRVGPTIFLSHEMTYVAGRSR